MKFSKSRLYIAIFSILMLGASAPRVNAQDVTVSYQTFYDDLSPYGQWVSDPQYGNVWVPNEGGDFRPYGTRGHWAMTDYGNTWVSDDPWGWAPYHYGRWTYDPYYGWVWIPGYEWAPAWVSWRFGGDNCGWAPLGPGISIGATYNCPDSWWVFVAPQYMYRDNCIHYWRGPSYNGGYIRQTTFVNNVYVDNGTHVRYNYGPRAETIQGVTHQPVQVYKVQRGERPGAPAVSGNRLSIYRPAVNRATATTARPGNVINAPRQIGRPQAAPSINAAKPAPFRQQLQSGAIRGNAGAPNQQGNRNGQPANVQAHQQGMQQMQQQRGAPAMQQQRPQQAQQQQHTQQMQQQRGQQEEQQMQQQRVQQAQQQQRVQQMQQQRGQQMEQQQRAQQQRDQQQAQQQQRSQQMQQQRAQQAQQQMQQQRNQQMQQQRNEQVQQQRAQQEQQRNQQMQQQQQRAQQQQMQQQRSQQMEQQRSQQMQQQRMEQPRPQAMPQQQARPQAMPQQHMEGQRGGEGGGRR